MQVKANGQKISEKVFQSQVIKAAKLCGFKTYHTFNSFRSTEGFPDLVLLNPAKKRMIVAELKSETGKTSLAQAEWLADFSHIPGVEVYLLRPSDFDTFWEILRR